ncbi:hypothetical protein N7468_008909 [Penicillium chermesinum]|uniref:Uncharacterized protein n=1 Tax=Penicillium chermesinum TaxID=63820 RepID=A0A9W9NGR1_9EURO|nr:uncharacterized protein N7468_008909 [Penicillium chermesinum]KAJ5219705.1 hypothetical protein N7468_008909 [Penicillium chermesinum]
MNFQDDFESERSESTDEEWWAEDQNEDSNDEQEIEEHEYSTSDDPARTIKIRLFLRDEGFSDSKWMKTLVAECTCDGSVVANALARYIDRICIRSEFWERMEEESEGMCDIAFNIFNRFGFIQTNPLFIIEELCVTAFDLRRKGLGQKMATLLLERAKRLSSEDEAVDDILLDENPESNAVSERLWTLHAFVSPGILTSEIESQLKGKSAEERLIMKEQLQFGAINFWRSCGFRRIGASHCFAYSFNLQHQSHALTAASDYNPRRSRAEELETEELQLIYESDRHIRPQDLRMERLRDTLPLHHAALTLTDEELKAFFVNHADDGTDWDRLTNSESTLLHLTACELKPLSTQWLLKNVHYADSWRSARDIKGNTPLEALQEKLEEMRSQKRVFVRVLNISDRFEGHCDTAVSCLSLLQDQVGLGSSEAYLRYGCTCGGCVGGFISARMRDSLISQGEVNYDLSREFINDGHYWVKSNSDILVHLDRDVRRNLKTNKSLRKGFVNIFQIAVECLEARRVPTPENLEWFCNNRSEWPPHTRNFLQRAGVQGGCRAVLRYMFDAAKEEEEYEEAGNGEFYPSSNLPTCRNDYEFEFVARVCGYAESDSM